MSNITYECIEDRDHRMHTQGLPKVVCRGNQEVNNEFQTESNRFKTLWAERLKEGEGIEQSIEESRKAFDDEHGAVPFPESCTRTEFSVEGVKGEKITPISAIPGKAIIYHHGGGHGFGSALSHRHLVARLAESSGVTAFNMDYALAPEQPFPAALNDAVAAWDYVCAQGYSGDDIVVAGESAGGNLTASLLLKLRETKREMPAGGYLLSPWLDLTQSGESMTSCADQDPMVTRSELSSLAKSYYAGTDPRNPLVSPIFGDLSGFPPMMIQVGTDEVLLSDAITFTNKSALSGVDVQLRVWKDMVHAWPLFHFLMPSAGLSAIDEAGAWIRGCLGE
ncbi:MAG: alpha/beta hydrolase fold domain-containing protein [Pseudomonadales bacterium]|nr:alpha/beta hydrolase fold domain-containing protein [Pseudomonadales bacterium]